MGTRGSWCRINYDGGDIGAIVRGGSEGAVIYSNPFDFDNLFTGSEVPVEQNGCEEIVPFSSIIKEDPENVCSTASSPGASEYKKYTPRSPKREFDHNSSPKEIEVKTEANDQSPSKICPSPKLPGIKKRKSQQRSMVCIPMVEGSWNKQGGAGVASDLWSWRKYGQKPIKGSPYPRGYYRCSSSKGCPARKQVERSRTDPTMLLITYTADHNHTSPAHRRALPRSSVHDNSFSPHDKKENTFSLSLQKPLSLSDPDAAIAIDHHHHDNMSPPNNLSTEHDHQEDINNNNNSILDNSLFEDDQQHLCPNNHIFHEDLFESFGDFSSVFQRDFMTRCSDEEDDCTMVDPFNLFDWSFSTNEWPNSNSSC